MERRNHTNLTTHVLASIGRDIATGAYEPGVALPTEDVLVKQFGASRTVIREAVKMLTAKGLVDTRPRRGTVVRTEADWNLADPDILEWLLHRKSVLPLILEFAEIRLAIEPAAAALAAQKADEASLAEIDDALTRMKNAERNEDDPLTSDISFHVAILKAANNRFFWSLRFMVEVALRFSIRITNLRKGVERANVADHEKILNAIIAHDQQAAEASMRALILESKMLLYNASESAKRVQQDLQTETTGIVATSN